MEKRGHFCFAFTLCTVRLTRLRRHGRVCAVVELRGAATRIKSSPVTEPPQGAALTKPLNDFYG